MKRNDHTILIVDDDRQNHEQLHQMITNYRILSAYCADEAWPIINREKISLILLDVIMPDVDGFELCRQIKERTSLAKIPILFISNAQQTESIVLGLSMGGSDYVVRPFIKEELLARIKTHLSVFEREETEKQLFRSSRLIGLSGLAAGVGHEINNPLMIVMGNLQRCLEKLQTEMNEHDAFRTSIRASLDAAGRIREIVKSFVRLVQPNSGPKELINPHYEIAAALRLLERSLKESNIDVETNFSSRCERLEATPGSIEQIALNLILNAQEALKNQRHPRILIATESDETNFFFRVTDNGKGIASDKLEHVFDPLFTTKGPRNGMGLGLTASQMVAADMGGQLTVRSQVGQGAVFELAVPI